MEKLIGIVCGAFVTWCLVMFILIARADNKCTALGYPSSNVTVSFHTYCIRRVNNSDEVIELK